MFLRIAVRIALWLTLALLATPATIGAEQSVESFYDARFPRNCSGQDVPTAVRQQLKSRLRSEFRKVNPAIEALGILEVECAFDDNKKLVGTLVLAYGTVADQDQAYEQFRKTKNIRELLASEQYGVFQFDPALMTLRKTITVFPSRRWRDYNVTIELKSATMLSLQANGSYGDNTFNQEFEILW